MIYEMLVPIYKKHLTENEIVAMIEFYEADEGKSVVSNLPRIPADSMQVDVCWG